MKKKRNFELESNRCQNESMEVITRIKNIDEEIEKEKIMISSPYEYFYIENTSNKDNPPIKKNKKKKRIIKVKIWV